MTQAPNKTPEERAQKYAERRFPGNTDTWLGEVAYEAYLDALHSRDEEMAAKDTRIAELERELGSDRLGYEKQRSLRNQAIRELEAERDELRARVKQLEPRDTSLTETCSRCSYYKTAGRMCTNCGATK